MKKTTACNSYNLMLIYIIDLKAKKETEADFYQGNTGNVRQRLKTCMFEGFVEEHSRARVLKE